jgi:hypothetical protein
VTQLRYGRTKLLGCLGVWLCDRFQPRPITQLEHGIDQQYVELMINSLRGQIPHYGRDRDEGQEPIICERRDYNKIYGRAGAREKGKP